MNQIYVEYISTFVGLLYVVVVVKLYKFETYIDVCRNQPQFVYSSPPLCVWVVFNVIKSNSAINTCAWLLLDLGGSCLMVDKRSEIVKGYVHVHLY